MQQNIALSAKALPGPFRKAAEELLGRPLGDEEMLGIFTLQDPGPARPMSQSDWEREMNEIIDGFPQTPLLPDEAITRESIYSREDEML